MTNHPNRSRDAAGRSPTPDEIKEAREAAQMTQTEAARKIYSSLRAWQNWEGGLRQMPAAAFELFLIKTGQIKAPK